MKKLAVTLLTIVQVATKPTPTTVMLTRTVQIPPRPTPQISRIQCQNDIPVSAREIVSHGFIRQAKPWLELPEPFPRHLLQ